MSEDQQIFWIFSPSVFMFYVSKKVCARWDQKVHQKLQKYAKKEFSEHFFFLPKVEQKYKADQSAKRETY